MIFSNPENLFPDHRRILLDGCFDPIHAGHIRQIRDTAHAFPTHRIVVTVASDEDIRQKGREPLFNQLTRCQIVDGLEGVRDVVAKDRPTHEVIGLLKPAAYVKGKDWEGKLPPEQLAACALHGVQIVYLGETRDSSTDRLRAWALTDADASLDRLERFMAGQDVTAPDAFDRDYFQGSWRTTPYTLEARRIAEGEHPDRIQACFGGLQILDVGCGPGFLVTLLKERGMKAGGIDPSAHAMTLHDEPSALHGTIDELPEKMCDVAICREVLEHLTVNDIGAMVAQLFRVARKFVYITTRFSSGRVFDAATDFETDPTHISLLTQPFLRSLCVLEGGKRRRDLEEKLDWMQKGRCLVYELL